MAKIIWKGIIKSEEDFPASLILEKAKKLDSEKDMKIMQLKALPFIIPLISVCLICMFVKTYLAGKRIVDFNFLLIGIFIGFLLIIAHELLHAVAFPKNATVYIGIMPKSFSAVALSASPIKRNRFIFVSILPILLGIIPLLIFCFGSNDTKGFNGLMFGMAVMGMVSVYPDVYNIYKILSIVPSNAILQNNKNDTYYYE